MANTAAAVISANQRARLPWVGVVGWAAVTLWVTFVGIESWSKIVAMNIASESWNRIESFSSGRMAAGQASETNPATFYQSVPLDCLAGIMGAGGLVSAG